MISKLRLFKLSLLALICAAYLVVSYFVAASSHANTSLLLMGLGPMAAIALAAAINSRHKTLNLFVWSLLVLLAVSNSDLLSTHVSWVYFAQHFGAMSILFATFASTLSGMDSQTLCSRVTCMILPALKEDKIYMRYTRNVTVAWSSFFFLSALISLLLFIWGSIEAWSFFANVVTPVLIGGMFAGEYALRNRFIPDRPSIGIEEIVRAYRRHT